MSDEKPAEPPAPKRKLKPMIIVAAAVLALGGGGFAGWRMFLAPPAAPAEKPLPIYVEVPPMVVNLDSPGAARFLKVRVVVAVRDEEAANKLKERLVEVTDRFLTLFRTLRPEDLAGAQGPFRIKEELIFRAAQVAGPQAVEDVLIQELVQQ